MEQLLSQLMRDARMEQAVAGLTLDNGMHMFAYPQEQGVLVAVGVGIGGGGQIQGASILRKRSHDMPRFGAWLPVQFNDGSWYVVRRTGANGDDAAAISEEELIAAEELLT